MKYAFISIGVLLLCYTGNGQSLTSKVLDSMRAVLQHCSNDSEKAALRAGISLQLAETFTDSALYMARQGITDAMAAKSKGAYACCLESIGWCYFKKENYDSAKYYYARSMDLYHSILQSYREAHVLINLSTLYGYENNWEKVLDCSLKALKLMEGQQHPLARALVEEKIGESYRKQDLNDKAMPYLQDAVQAFRDMKQDGFLGAAFLNLGLLYDASKKYDSAFICIREGGQAYKRCNYAAGEEAAYSKIADEFLALSTSLPMQSYTDSALLYYQLAYSLAVKTGRSLEQAVEKYGIGNALFGQRKYEEAARYMDEALQVFAKERLFDESYKAASTISKLYKEKGNYKRAADYLQESVIYKDSLDAINRKESMANMFASYEAEKKDKTIQLLNAQKALAAKELSRNRVIAFFTFCLAALIIALAIVLWRQGHIKQQLKEVQMRNQIAGDLHDEIGSSLSSILLLSNMASKNRGKKESSYNLDKIGYTAREVIEKTSDIVWAMNPQHDRGVSVKERIEKLAIQIREVSSLQIDIHMSKRMEERMLPMALRKNIFLICKEALHNIVKHADATVAELFIDDDNKHIELEIKDNGRGFHPDNHDRGHGLKNMEQRVGASGGNFRIVTAPGQGTCVLVTLPIPHSRYMFS